MARPNWEYIRIDVRLGRHPKLDGLSRAVKWTLVELWMHCGEELTDGFVRASVWQATGTPSLRQKLLERGLAMPVDNGYQMHDFLDYQRSRRDVEALAAKRSLAGKIGGRAKAEAIASARQVLAGLPPLATASKRGKSLAEAEAEAEIHVAEVVTTSVEGVIHRPGLSPPDMNVRRDELPACGECGAILDPDGTCFACRTPQPRKAAG